MNVDDLGATAWTPTDLATIDRTGEVKVATRRADGTLRPARIVWIVRHGDALYVRSANGRDAASYRGVQTRHAGVVTVGQFSHNVEFTEAGDHAGNETGLDNALTRPIGPSTDDPPARSSTSPPSRRAQPPCASTPPKPAPETEERHGQEPHHHDGQDTGRKFTGDVWMNPVFNGDGTSKLTVGLVRFTPGARTNWHRHANGQLLVCTDGVGRSAPATGAPSCRRGQAKACGPPPAKNTSTAAPRRTWIGSVEDQVLTRHVHHLLLVATHTGSRAHGSTDPSRR